jgi:hypothetical protein
LDSWDLDINFPNPSALHGLGEFLAMSRHFKTGSLLLVDDTPRDVAQMAHVQPKGILQFERYFEMNGFYPGKGALIKQLLKAIGRGHAISHQYQLLWQF